MGTILGGFVLMVCGAMCAGLGILMNKAPSDSTDGKKKKKKKKADGPKRPARTGSLVYGGGALAVLGLAIMVWGIVK